MKAPAHRKARCDACGTTGKSLRKYASCCNYIKGWKFNYLTDCCREADGKLSALCSRQFSVSYGYHRFGNSSIYIGACNCVRNCRMCFWYEYRITHESGRASRSRVIEMPKVWKIAASIVINIIEDPPQIRILMNQISTNKQYF